MNDVVISIFRCADAQSKLVSLKKNVEKIINVIRQNNVSITYFVIHVKNYTFIGSLFENNKSKGTEYCVAIWLLRHSFHQFS